MRGGRLIVVAALGSCGCFLLDRDKPKLPTPPDPTRFEAKSQKLVQANVEACTRVYTVGQKILAVNPELPQRLIFRAAGTPNPELFHQGTSSVVITQKLIEMCQDDSELAALLCVELGKMIAEREALTPPESRQPSPKPPIEAVTFRGDGGLANPDPLRLRELAHYEAEQRKQVGQNYLPDPLDLARRYLHRAGYRPELIDKVRPLLRVAGENADLENQMRSAPRVTPFVPPGG